MIEFLGLSASVLVFVLLTLAVAYVSYTYLYKPYTYFDGLGIPGPRPVPVLGNIGMVWRMKGSMDHFIKHLISKYGKMCRVFYGMKGGVVFADPDAIEEVMVKQFDNFTDRRSGSSLSANLWGEEVDYLNVAKGDTWRRRRKILSPAFSAHKINLGVKPLVKESVDRLVDICRQHATNGQTVDAAELFGNLSMEVILATAYGVRINIQKSDHLKEDHPIYKASKELLKVVNREDPVLIPLQMLSDSHPVVRCLMKTVINMFTLWKPLQAIADLARIIVRKRRARMEEGDLPTKDMLQLLIEASQEGGKHLISEAEMVVDMINNIMMIAGYETTSTTLACTAYQLALNATVQDRLAEEVLQYFEDNPDKTALDAAQEVDYVEMVISEVLRMHPAIFFVDRICTKPCTVAGVPFKEGMFAVIPIECVYYDPDIWPEPNKFDPERFSSEEKDSRHPCAYIPFSVGPRNCVGMRFAQMEVRMALIEIIGKFRIVRTPETKVPMTTTGFFLKTPAPGVASVRFELRE